MALRSGLLILSLTIALAGCGGKGRPETLAPTPAQWRKTVTALDRDRLGDWRASFVNALAMAQASRVKGRCLTRTARLAIRCLPQEPIAVA
jgi:predicted small lipoprotein YifL